MSYTKPLPLVNADTLPFWDGCRQHRLKFQKCLTCGFLRWPPAFLCPKCHSKDTEWVVSKGKGRVYTFAVYHTAFHPGFADELPYVVAIVDTEEGPRLMTNIKGCDPDEVYCGMPVEVTWNDATEEFTIPVFCPEKKGD